MSWSPGEERRPALPRVEELPAVPGGYDRAAVEAAFDAFYRHTAQLDATLATLESVDAFQKQASELRADIRALRAASWGPLPGRQTWAAGYAVRASSPRGGFLDVAPRLAVEAAFIILVAVGAAVADLGTTTVVLVVVAAWLVVGLAEVLATLTRGEPGPPAFRPAPRPAGSPPAAAPTVVVQAAVRDPWEAPALEPEPELEPAEEPQQLPEPEPAAEAPQEPAEPEAPARRRFWRRREDGGEPEQGPDFAEALRPAPAPEELRPAPAPEELRPAPASEELRPAPASEEPEADTGEITPVAPGPVAPAAQPERPLLRRGRR